MIIFAEFAVILNKNDVFVITVDPFVKLEKSIISVLLYLHDVNSIFLGRRLSISMKIS